MAVAVDLTDDRVVALLAEGVDRNIDINREFTAAAKSPSSRRAWIEIPTP